MKKGLKFIALMLALVLMIHTGALAYSGIPIVPEGEEVTLSMVRPYQYNSRPTEELWFFKFAEEFLNIKFEVETTEDRAAYKQLSFASGTMPDLYCYMGVSASEQMMYGAGEGLIVDLAPYIDNGTMANLAAFYAENPTYRSKITAPNGAIYGLGLVRDFDIPGLRIYWNVRWLEEAGYGIPTTLDEMIEAVYAVKAQRGADATPLGGGYKANNPIGYILNAFGYITSSGAGDAACLRNGEVVIPYGDREAFGDFLTLMNKFYNDGIISKDFYTLDDNTFRALCGEDKVGMMGTAPYVIMPESFDEWDAVIPLKSEYNNNTAAWLDATQIVTCDAAIITSNCENIEAAAKFLDWFYDAENMLLGGHGPTVDDTEYQMGMVGGWYMDEEYKIHYADFDKGDSGFASEYDYKMGKLFGTHWEFGMDNRYDVQQAMFGLEPIGRQYDPLDGDDNYRLTVIENLLPYAVSAFPHITFFDVESTEAMADLRIALDTYAEAEIAKFITGIRSLDTLNVYFDTLDSMGFQEYLKYYVDYYAAYTATK